MRSFFYTTTTTTKTTTTTIIIDVLGRLSQEMDTTMKEIVGSRSKEVLKRLQKAVLSGTLNIKTKEARMILQSGIYISFDRP